MATHDIRFLLMRIVLVLLGTASVVRAAPAQTVWPLSHESPDQCMLDATSVAGTVFRVSPTEHKPTGDPALIAAITERQNRGIELFREALPGLIGYNAEYARNWKKNPQPDKPEPYHADLRTVAHYCAHNELGKPGVFVAGKIDSYDMSNDIRLAFNAGGKFFLQEQEMTVDGMRHKVYETRAIGSVLRGVQLWGVNRAWHALMARNGQSPFIALTERQYLGALLQYFDDAYGAPGAVQKRGMFPAAYVQKAREEIHAYLANTPASRLDRAAHTFQSLGTWQPNFFEPQAGNDHQIWMFDRRYLRDDLPHYVPQFIVLDWDSATDYSDLVLAQKFEKNFPFDKLQAMIDK